MLAQDGPAGGGLLCIEERASEGEGRERRYDGEDYDGEPAHRIASTPQGALHLPIASPAENAPPIGAGGDRMALALHPTSLLRS